jgi:hypothetical protein
MTFEKRKPILLYISNDYISGLNDEQKQYISEIVHKYMDSSDTNMKIAAYRTEPMRYILEQEKSGRNMTRVPILYKDTSVLDIDKKD